MPIKNLDANAIGQNEDWEGNNAAFRCPACQKIFLVSILACTGILMDRTFRGQIAYCLNLKSTGNDLVHTTQN